MKNKTKNTSFYVGYSILFFILFIWGFEYEVAGARNLCLFYIWFTFLIMVAACCRAEKIIEVTRKTKSYDNYIPDPVKYVVSTFIVVALVWYGYIATAVVSAVASIITYTFISLAKEKN